MERDPLDPREGTQVDPAADAPLREAGVEPAHAARVHRVEAQHLFDPMLQASKQASTFGPGFGP